MNHILNPLIASLGEWKDLRRTPRLMPSLTYNETPDDMYANCDAYHGVDDDERCMGMGDAMDKFSKLGTFHERNERKKKCQSDTSLESLFPAASNTATIQTEPARVVGQNSTERAFKVGDEVECLPVLDNLIWSIREVLDIQD